MEFSSQEYWSGFLFLFPGALPHPRSNLGLLHCSEFFTIWTIGLKMCPQIWTVKNELSFFSYFLPGRSVWLTTSCVSIWYIQSNGVGEYSSFQFCHLLLISIGLLPLLGVHFFLCKQTMIFPCPPCTKKEKKMGRLSVRTLRLCPAGQTISKLLAQATRKSDHQLDLEMHMEVRRFASNICPRLNTGSLPQEML